MKFVVLFLLIFLGAGSIFAQEIHQQKGCNLGQFVSGNFYFELNETDNFPSDKVQWIKSLLEEYPQMCIEFSHSKNSSESDSIGSIRLNNFREELLDAEVRIGSILFSSTEHILPKSLSDQRGRIEGAVHSLEGNCKKNGQD